MNAIEFKKLYQGSFEKLNAQTEDTRVSLVVAVNYNHFKIWKRYTGEKNAIYIGIPGRFRGYVAPYKSKLVLLDGFFQNRKVVDSYLFDYAYRTLEVIKLDRDFNLI